MLPGALSSAGQPSFCLHTRAADGIRHPKTAVHRVKAAATVEAAGAVKLPGASAAYTLPEED